MIDHVSIPVLNLAAAARFYDAVLTPLGLKRMVERERTIGFGSKYPEFWLNRRDGHAVRADSGHHVCLRAPSETAVRDFFAAAIAAGGVGDGDPGTRTATMTDPFAAFILDPDGNKIEAMHFPRT